MRKPYTVERFSSEQEWLERRKQGVSASEIGAVVGLNPYTCAAKLFYQKLGLAPSDEENLAMLLGKYFEDDVAYIWERYDPVTEGATLYENLRDNKRVRRARRMQGLLRSKEYPWLTATPDRVFSDERFPGETLYLELKTIEGYAADKWAHGVPPSYLMQVMGVLIVGGWKYGELALLKNGRRLEVFPFDFNEDVARSVLAQTKTFFDNLEAARGILAAGGTEMDIQDLVPPPDGSDAYTEFLKERYGDAPSELEAPTTQDVLEHVGKWIAAEQELEEVKQRMEYAKQILRLHMKEATVINLSDIDRVTWRPDKNGNRSFRKKLSPEMVQYLLAEKQRLSDEATL